MHNYLSLIKHNVKDDYAVIIIDNSDIPKPASRKPEALSEIRDGNTGKITQGYFSIKAAVLSEKGKMPLFSEARGRFVIRAKKNRNVIYNGEARNIMDVALQYKGAYRKDFKIKEKAMPHHHQSVSAQMAD